MSVSCLVTILRRAARFTHVGLVPIVLLFPSGPVLAFDPPPAPGSAPVVANEPPVLTDNSAIEITVSDGESFELELPGAASRGSDPQGDAFAFALVGAGEDGVLDTDGGRVSIRSDEEEQVLVFAAEPDFSGVVTFGLRLLETATTPPLGSAGSLLVEVSFAMAGEPEPILDDGAPIDEMPLEEEAPEEEFPGEGLPAEELPEEEMPAEELPGEEVPAEEMPAEELPEEEVPADEMLAEEQPIEEVPAMDEMPETGSQEGEMGPPDAPRPIEGAPVDDVPSEESVSEEQLEGDPSVEAPTEELSDDRADGGGSDGGDGFVPLPSPVGEGESPAEDESVDPVPELGETDAGIAMFATPAGFRVVLIDARAVVLEWEPVDGASGYEVARDGVTLGTSDGTLFVDGDVVLGQAYAYSVVALDGSGEIGSAAASLRVAAEAVDRPDNVRPLAPGEVFARRDADGSVVLAWRPGGDDIAVAGYNVYRNGLYHDTAHALGYRDVDAPEEPLTFYEVVAFDGVPNFSRLSPAVLVEPLRAPDRVVETLDVEGASVSADERTRVSLDGEGAVLLVAGGTVTGLFPSRVVPPSVTLDLADGESLSVLVLAGSVDGADEDLHVRLAPAAVAALGSDIRVVIRPAEDGGDIAVTFAPR